jgi:hypothetical protein
MKNIMKNNLIETSKADTTSRCEATGPMVLEDNKVVVNLKNSNPMNEPDLIVNKGSNG